MGRHRDHSFHLIGNAVEQLVEVFDQSLRPPLDREPAAAQDGSRSRWGVRRGRPHFAHPGRTERKQREQRLSVLCALRELAEASAGALGFLVYSGDVVVGEDGSMVVIDWPSFAVVRDVAGEKIARARQRAMKHVGD